jgi:hypothetical protein
MAAPGELIVNRHQERAADGMLGGSGALASIVQGIKRPHWAPFATGGRLGGLRGHIGGVANAVLSRFPGLSVTSTTGGGHADGSYHYLGEAVDLGGASSTMNAAARWIMSSGLYRQLVEGIHNPNLSVKGGRPQSAMFWGPQTWAAHRNHLHLAALGGVMTPFGGAGLGGTATSNPLGRGAINVGGGRLFGHAAVAQAAANAIMGFRSFASTSTGVGGGGAQTQTSPAPAGGTVYSKRQLMSLAASVGFPDPNMAAAIALAESSGRANATNRNTDGSIDRGLWEINSIHGPLSVLDPRRNAESAYKISSGGRNWNPWVTYQNGAYKQYLGGGGRLKYAGAFEAGGMFRTNGPTAFVAGDGSSPHETVTVSKGHSQGAPGGLHIGQLTIHTDGSQQDIEQKVKEALRQAWADFSEELERTSPAGVRF